MQQLCGMVSPTVQADIAPTFHFMILRPATGTFLFKENLVNIGICAAVLIMEKDTCQHLKRLQCVFYYKCRLFLVAVAVQLWVAVNDKYLKYF